MLRQQAIAKFLSGKTHPDLAVLFDEGMECQVNVAQDGAEKVSGTTKSGHAWKGFTEDGEVWKDLRIPWRANTDPEYVDSELTFSVDHFEAVGMTGWSWARRSSAWVGFDFDSIVGHRSGLADDELLRIRRSVEEVPWVTVRKSTSGKGLHLYVFLDPQIPTATHTEHAALARAVLGLISARVGCSLRGKVDTCGGVLWVWHRRMAADGYALVREGVPLSDVPVNWRDHEEALSGKGTRKARPPVGEGDQDALDELVTRTRTAPLDDQHKLLMGWLSENRAYWWWDADRGILVAHTFDLQEAHRALRMRGPFYTSSTGKDRGRDQNCFAFPIRNGGWTVRRHTRRTLEHPAWTVDGGGWTRCYLNCPANFITACRCHGAVERADGRFEFQSVLDAFKALADLGGVLFECSDMIKYRPALLREHKDGRAILSAMASAGDGMLQGWSRTKDGTWWERLVDIQNEEPDVEVPDEFVRHLVSASCDAGWVIFTRSCWIEESESNVCKALSATGVNRKLHQAMLGQCVLHPWYLVSRPFQPEYPGDRTWNRRAPQYAHDPVEGEHPTWTMLLEHCGAGLDEAVEESGWCREGGITSGGQYLKAWVACMLQQPGEPLPYLFFYGPQNSGKSIFHEALSTLFKDRVGYVKADVALTSQSRFNGEIANVVLCAVEEVNLQSHRDAYARVKDWVTGRTILIHEKGRTPYEVHNTTHWVQVANELDHCPSFSGDTRIVIGCVDMPERQIPKVDLLAKLEVEAPAFTHAVTMLEVPKSPDRLRVPTVSSAEKVEMESSGADPVGAFFRARLFPCVGNVIQTQEVYDRFFAELPVARRSYWDYRRFVRSIPNGVVRGKWGGSNTYCVANVAFDPKSPPGLRTIVRSFDRLVEEGAYL